MSGVSGDMELNSGSTNDQAEIEQILSKIDNTTFEGKDWNTVIMECRSLAANWEQLSGYIGLSFDLIDSIKGNHPNNNSGCWNEALKQWIKQNYEAEKFGKPSWQSLLKAISLVDKRLFKKLAADHHQVCVKSEDDKGSVTDGTEPTVKDDGADKPITPSTHRKVVIKPNYTFPLLNLKEMNEDEKERLHQRLFAESEAMEDRFQELFKATRMSLVERKITMGDLLKHLDCLGSVKPLYKGSELPVFGRQLPRLRETENVDNAMSVISSYCSFFNYRIVECIIENLGTKQDKTNLEKYKEEFSVYAQRHVFECPAELGEIDEDEHANMFVTLDTTYDSYTVSHLYAFVNNLQRVLKIPAMSLRLCRIGPGSLKLFFQLPFSVQQTTFSLSDDQEAALTNLGVILLSCGDYLFSQQANEEDELSSHCGGDSDHTDSERSVESLENRDAELASMADRLAVMKSEGAPSIPDSAISIGRSSTLTRTTAGVTQFSEDISDRDLEDFTMVMRHQVALKDDGDHGDFKLHIASLNGDLQEVMRLVEEEHLSPLQKDNHGKAALHYAAIGGHLNVLRYFIEDRGCNAAYQGQDRWTPLHYAAVNKHLHIVQYLIEKQQVEPFSRNKHDHTALHQACIGGSIDVIHYLAKEMSKYLSLKDVVHDRHHDGAVPMHAAAGLGHLDACKFLITTLNCDFNTTDDKKRTVIHYAAAQGHLPIVKYFIEQHHCDPSCLDVERWTPLHYAAFGGQLNVVQYLTLEQHCDPMCTDEFNDTPLHFAADSGHLQVVKFFTETCQYPVEIRGWRNMTPLERAHRNGHHHVVEYLESISNAYKS